MTRQELFEMLNEANVAEDDILTFWNEGTDEEMTPDSVQRFAKGAIYLNFGPKSEERD